MNKKTNEELVRANRSLRATVTRLRKQLQVYRDEEKARDTAALEKDQMRDKTELRYGRLG